MGTIVRFIRDDSGASAVEYGLMAVATGLAVAAIMPILKSS
jgi:Flp pilus assembly pilin Flp